MLWETGLMDLYSLRADDLTFALGSACVVNTLRIQIMQ